MSSLKLKIGRVAGERSARRQRRVLTIQAYANVRTWLKGHPRFVIHKVPTSSSWLNLIERWFRELTTKRIRRDAFASLPELVAAIEEFLEVWNQDPKPFVWRATVDSILDKLSGCRQTLEQIQPGCTHPPQRRSKNRPVN